MIAAANSRAALGVAALEPTEMATWLEYIPLVIFALLMFTMIARGFPYETRFDRLLIVLGAIIGVAIGPRCHWRGRWRAQRALWASCSGRGGRTR
jgi:hypothetical protein